MTRDTTERNNLNVVRPVLRAIAVLALLVPAACKRGASDGPACGAVGAKFFALANADVVRTLPEGTAAPSEAMRRAVLDQLPAMRDSIVAVCTDSKWSAAVRTCLVEAPDHVAFEACEQQLTETQRRDLDRSARGQESATTDAN